MTTNNDCNPPEVVLHWDVKFGFMENKILSVLGSSTNSQEMTANSDYDKQRTNWAKQNLPEDSARNTDAEYAKFSGFGDQGGGKLSATELGQVDERICAGYAKAKPLLASQPTLTPLAAEPVPPYAAHGPYAVGARDFGVQDGDHVITFTVWYPALNPDNAREEITYYTSDVPLEFANLPITGRAIQNAAPDTAHGPYPLVLFSTEFTGFRHASVYLLEHLASYGFVVMASDPHDSPDWAAFTRPIRTKLAISFADKATALGGALERLLDMKHIAVVGLGFGGSWAALLAGGAHYDLSGCAANSSLGTECGDFINHGQEIATQLGLQTVPSGPWPPMSDSRVGAIIALTPAEDTIWGAAYEGVAAMKVPAMVMGNTFDVNNPYVAVTYPVYPHLGSAQKGLIQFQKAGWPIFYFSCQDAPWWANNPDAGCDSPNWDIQRAHDLINHFATAFLLAELNPRIEAHFGTIKTMPAYPGFFVDELAARLYFASFYAWYNNVHPLTTLAMLTPMQWHTGQAPDLLAARRADQETAQRQRRQACHLPFTVEDLIDQSLPDVSYLPVFSWGGPNASVKQATPLA